MGWFLGIWALVGVPVLYVFVLYAAYWLARINGQPSYTVNADPLWFIPLGVLLLSGSLAVFKAVPKLSIVRWPCTVLYLVLIGYILLWLRILVGCGHGDCF